MDRNLFSPAKIARRTWELENMIPDEDTPIGSTSDSSETIKKLLRQKPWSKDLHYFKRAKISALALLKMVMHARSGGNVEIMGLMQGKIDVNEMIVTDAFALPVEGSETRVNAQADANEYSVEYTELSKQVGRLENVVGWYHSHPGYGCWLSGIDVTTQRINQTFQDPFLAVVVDPTRTVSAGKVDIGAFRTYPEGYKPPFELHSEYQSIPYDKIEDFGVHSKQYYPLEITYFKSPLDSHLLDLLWNQHWMSTLSSSPLLANKEFVADQISDLADKVERADSEIVAQSLAKDLPTLYTIGKKKEEESQLSKVNRDSKKMTMEQIHGLMAQVIKDVLFNSVGPSNPS